MNADHLLSTRIRESQTPDAVMMRNPPPGLILFGGGSPDPTTHPVAEMTDALAEMLAARDSGVLSYGPAAGDLGLRELIAERAGREGARLTAENVVLTNGSSGAIGLTAVALIEPGDVVVTERLTYAGALKAFGQMGAVFETAPFDEEGLDPAGLAEVVARVRAEGRRVKLIYTISTCHNPTGTILSLERRREILDIAETAGALVVQDDTYGDIRFETAPPPFIALAPERTVHLGSFSKTIAPGLRVGWAAAGAAICEAFAWARVDLGTSPAMQRFVGRFVAEGRFDNHLREVTAHYLRKRDLMLAALGRHCHNFVDWRTPAGGFFIWLQLRGGDVAAVSEAALKENVAFLPGPYFSGGVGHPQNLRLAYGQIAEDRIEEGVARLGRALAESVGNAG